MLDEEPIILEELNQVQLQEYLDKLYDDYSSSRDKVIRKEMRNKWKMASLLYNSRVKHAVYKEEI